MKHATVQRTSEGFIRRLKAFLVSGGFSCFSRVEERSSGVLSWFYGRVQNVSLDHSGFQGAWGNSIEFHGSLQGPRGFLRMAFKAFQDVSRDFRDFRWLQRVSRCFSEVKRKSKRKILYNRHSCNGMGIQHDHADNDGFDFRSDQELVMLTTVVDILHMQQCS